MKKITLLFGFFLFVSYCFAQPGVNDPTFNPYDVGFGQGDGFNGSVHKVLIQPDGKIIAGGSFDKYNSTNRELIARLNVDGSLDVSFNPSSQPANGGYIHDMALQSDGKIIAGGHFDYFNNNEYGNIIRVEDDGSIDTTFTIGSGFNDWVYSVIVQPDGKIIVGGEFVSYNGINCYKIARLNSDGLIDNSFNTGTAFQGSSQRVYDMILQTDGKIIVAGDFNSFNGITQNQILRLNTDGSLDTTFITGSGFDQPINAIELQQDGKIIAAGPFQEYNTHNITSLVRLYPNGDLDTLFIANFPSPMNIKNIVLYENQNIIVSGSGSTGGIKRLNNNGIIDTTFNVLISSTVLSIALHEDENIVASGSFQYVNGVIQKYITRLLPDGTVDIPFRYQTGFNNNISIIEVLPDNKIIVLGGNSYNSFNGEHIKRFIRLNSNGDLDTTFTQLNITPRVVKIRPEGIYLPGGQGISRMSYDGISDLTYESATINNTITSLDFQPDGKIIAVGSFVSPRWSIARLNTDGSLDASYNASTEVSVSKVVVQSDGKAIIGGGFNRCNSSDRIHIARFNLDGSIDETFTSPFDEDTYVSDLLIQPDGKIIVNTSNYQDELYQIYRLNTNGTIDNSFYASFDSIVVTMKLMPEGRLLVGGRFSLINGVSKSHIALLYPDGNPDECLKQAPAAIMMLMHWLFSLMVK